MSDPIESYAQQTIQDEVLGSVNRPTPKAVLEAYAQLYPANPWFVMIVNNLITTVLLRECKTMEEEGERRMVLRILRAIQAGHQIGARE